MIGQVEHARDRPRASRAPPTGPAPAASRPYYSEPLLPARPDRVRAGRAAGHAGARAALDRELDGERRGRQPRRRRRSRACTTTSTRPASRPPSRTTCAPSTSRSSWPGRQLGDRRLPDAGLGGARARHARRRRALGADRRDHAPRRARSGRGLARARRAPRRPGGGAERARARRRPLPRPRHRPARRADPAGQWGWAGTRTERRHRDRRRTSRPRRCSRRPTGAAPRAPSARRCR